MDVSQIISIFAPQIEFDNMDRKGFIKFNTRYSTDKSGKASSYARAIEILDDVLQHQNVIDFDYNSLS